MVPDFTLDSFQHIKHNSVLVKYKNLNEMNEYPTGIELSGKIFTTNDTVNYFSAIFSEDEGVYSTMLYDLLPSMAYTIKFYYGHKNIINKSFFFQTANVETLIDQRDGKSYPIAKFGNQWWMLENLNYSTLDGLDIADSFRTGTYYTWESASIACPSGWHLPSDEEWIELEKYVGVGSLYLYDTSALRGQNEVAKLLVPTSFTMYSGLADDVVVNELGFSLKACGYFPENRQDELPQGFGLDGYYWTSTEFNSTDAFYHGTSYKAVTSGEDSIMSVRLYMSKDNKMCVRCVKD